MRLLLQLVVSAGHLLALAWFWLKFFNDFELKDVLSFFWVDLLLRTFINHNL